MDKIGKNIFLQKKDFNRLNGYFEAEVINPEGPNYYKKIVNEFIQQRIASCKETPATPHFFVRLGDFMKKTVELFGLVENEKIEPNRFNIKQIEVSEFYGDLKGYSQQIKELITINEISKAIALKNIYLSNFEKALIILDEMFFIDLERSPYEAEIQKAKDQFKINTDEFHFLENITKSQLKPKKKKPGRKSVEVKEAKEYLQKFEFPESKVKFLNALKKEYADATPKTFNHVMIALNDLGYLKPATKTEYRQAFEKALSREPQSKQNFDKQFEITPSTLKNTNFYEGIKSNILEIIQSKTLV